MPRTQIEPDMLPKERTLIEAWRVVAAQPGLKPLSCRLYRDIFGSTLAEAAEAHETRQGEPDMISRAAADVLAERRRQIYAEGWTLQNDDKQSSGELADAAALYASLAARHLAGPSLWPWAMSWWKPKNRRRDLVRAGALIIAEIERLDRASAKPEGEA
ncbi:hypothetical protein AncyloWKF20_05315 [Ancylobacter sp. WKF20]|uniref:hypothetical protein n=1 Tax=Ancylobacter sp. WKF20 TaxID=3039801 RepID=UPI0024342FD7|nr:hypothetical protein [Ancylobacter sp. WKF20]WGD31244.1 hypothetical protein AncyloWKF20_05315 [Ancylobacter sp. WKF20]